MIGSSIGVFAQNTINLLPIKTNQKWGFIDTAGQVRVVPIYDNLEQLQFEENTFFLVEEGGKIGILDENARRILPCEYRRIRPLSSHYFAVILDSLEIVVNDKNEVIVGDKFDFISMLNQDFFAFRKGKKWGLYRRNQGILFPPKYNLIVPIDIGKGYFKIMNRVGTKELWGLCDLNGQELLIPKYDETDALGDNKLLYRVDKLWGMINNSGKEVLKKEWSSYGKLSKYYTVWQHEDGSLHLYLNLLDKFFVSDKRIVRHEVLRNDITKLKVKTDFRIGLIDSIGNLILPIDFQEILVYSDSIYKVKDGGWGLFHVRDSMVLKPEFSDIGEFENGLARIYLGDYQGFINQKYEVVIPAVYQKLKLIDQTLKAYERGTVTIFKRNAANKFDLDDVFENVGIIKIGGNGGSSSGGGSRGSASWIDPYKFGDYKWEREGYGLWGLKNLTTKAWVVQPKYKTVKVIHNAKITLVYNDSLQSSNRLRIFTSVAKEQFYEVGIFSNQSLQVVSNIDMVGIRTEDFLEGSKSAAFMSAEGKFGLIGLDGRIVKPATEFYIGAYKFGLMAFPIGDGIVQSQRTNPKTFTDSWGLDSDFNIYYDGSLRSNRRSNYLEIDKGIWGYMDENGRVVVAPKFILIRPFEANELVTNRTVEGWGVMNAKTKTIIPFDYQEITHFGKNDFLLKTKNNTIVTLAENGRAIDDQYIGQGRFSEGLARVAKRDANENLIWGFVNESFEEVIPCQYKKVKNFQNGMAAVLDTCWHFMDKSGNITVNLHKVITEIGDFYEDLAWVKLGSTYGYIDANGVFLMKPIFTAAADFTGFGVANVAIDKQSTLIDRNGNRLIENGIFGHIYNLDENGLAKVQHPRRRMFGLINYGGEIITPMIYDQIGTFQNGLAAVRLQGKFGFVDVSGKVVVNPIYDKIGEPADGLIPVFMNQNQVWHYIDYQGNKTFSNQFFEAGNFNKGYAIVKIKEDKSTVAKKVTALIDTDGNYHFVSSPDKVLLHYSDGFRAIEETQIDEFSEPRQTVVSIYYADENNYNIFGKSFKEVYPFEGMTGFFVTEEGWGALNRQGFSVIPAKYIRLIRMEDGNIRGKARYLYGIYNAIGEVVQPIQYDTVLEIQPNLFRVEKDGKIGYLNENGDWIWEMQE
jgi:hypothetical protein